MQYHRSKIFLIVAGALLFNWVFWNEEMALNTVLYDLFILVVLFSLYPTARFFSTVRWLLAGHLICLAMVVVHNTGLSKLATSVTLPLLATFSQFAHRSVLYAGGSVMENFVLAVPGFIETLETRGRVRRRVGISRIIRFLFIPILVAIVFFTIYSFGNSVFKDLANRAWNELLYYARNFFRFFSWTRLAFVLVGMLITTAIILKSKLRFFSKKEEDRKDDLVRERRTQRRTGRGIIHYFFTGVMGKLANGIMAIKNFNRIGLISLLLLNVMLLFVNAIDISYIWFGYKPYAVSLYKMVHEGANMLMLSILLAMIVLLVFFKGNLNFYRRNKWLRFAAYSWIAQNLVLVVSVFLRDYYYIREAGLARNRIGILFYLLMVVVGLLTVAWKIYRRKTVYFLLRINGWAALALLVASTTVNWDEQIVNYNLSRKDEIVLPVYYMVELSDSVLPILDSHRETLRNHIPLIKKFGYWNMGDCEECWEGRLDDRILHYKREQENYSWLSWSQADKRARNYFHITYHSPSSR